MLRKRLPLATLIFIGVLVLGTVGYRYIEGWSWLESLWMVLITVTTIGYGEVRPLSPEGRLFTLCFILGSLSVGTYTLTRITQYLLEGDLIRDLRDRRRRRAMDRR